jgi:hypothetical protein
MNLDLFNDLSAIHSRLRVRGGKLQRMQLTPFVPA